MQTEMRISFSSDEWWFWLKEPEAQQHDFLYSHLVNFPGSLVNAPFS